MGRVQDNTPPVSLPRRTDQDRAAAAWKAIEQADQASRKGKLNAKEYGSWARGLPAMLQTNGLGQTLAFLKAKGEGKADKMHSVLYRHLCAWVGPWVGLPAETRAEDRADFLQWIVTQSSDVYRRASAEAIAYALWLRRFAEAKGWDESSGGETPPPGDGA
jgi:CRISPR-associated protein Cmr5